MDVETVAAQLYAVPVADFTAARDGQVKAARDAGDAAVADAIKRRRRPTVSAWLVNQLIRQSAADIETLIDLGDRLRTAQEDQAAADLRELSAVRRGAIADLVTTAVRIAAAAAQPVSQTVLSEVRASLDAGSVDPDSATALRRGQLEKPLQHYGFGPGTTTSTGAPLPKPELASASRSASASAHAISAARAAVAASRRVAAAADHDVARAERAVTDASDAVAAAQRVLRHARAALSAAKHELSSARRRQTDAQDALGIDETSLERAHSESATS